MDQAPRAVLQPVTVNMAIRPLPAGNRPIHSGVMSVLPQILEHNAAFVAGKGYEEFLTSPLPNKRLVIVTCMDTRLVELLPKAMGIRNGDVKMIKIAGAVVSHPFGSVMRSILVAVYQLGAEEIAVVGHHGCGMTGFNPDEMLNKAHNRGISPDTFNTLRRAGVDLRDWLTGFERPEAGVLASVDMIRNHPLLPKDIIVHGLVMQPDTGRLELLTSGDAATAGAAPGAATAPAALPYVR